MSALATTVIEVPDLSRLGAASDQELMDALQACAAARRQVDAVMAELSGEVARRSSYEHGYAGLAQRTGARTPDGLVSKLTGSTGPESRQLVTVGTLMTDPQPWLANVAAGVAAGDVSVGAAAAISTGLGAPSASVAADDLHDAAARLLTEAAQLPPEKLARRARELRDELDTAGVADRERALRDRRFLRLSLQPDGMTRLFGMLDPESAALVTDAIDCVTAPRRGGPRFVDPVETGRAGALQRDPRTTEQLALDALVEMVRIAATADPGTVFGARKPSVRVHVTAADLHNRHGAATIEGQSAAVSIATAERFICADGYIPVLFHPGGSLDVGRTQRTFTVRQRIALAAIWGGCAHPDCDREPSWTEAHHAVSWQDGGRTDIANGVLLCRHHHMLVHNNHWTIRPPRHHGERWLMHPPLGDPLQGEPIELATKHPDRILGNQAGAPPAMPPWDAKPGSPPNQRN
jgi:hypothetical protein